MLLRPEERLGQPAVQQPAVETAHPERLGTLLPQHRAEVHRLLPPGQRIPEPAGGGQARAAGRQHPQFRVLVRGDLQHEARIGKTMDLVEHDGSPGRLPGKERFGVSKCPSGGGQVAVQVERIGQHPGERRLPDAPHAGKPDDGPPGPRATHPFEPDRTTNHMAVLDLDGPKSKQASVWTEFEGWVQGKKELSRLRCARVPPRKRPTPRLVGGKGAGARKGQGCAAGAPGTGRGRSSFPRGQKR